MNAPATKQKVSMDIMVLAQFYAYVFQGFFITILCGLLTHVIFINKSLWRSYKIIAWQTFVGTLMGASQMMAGIARLITFYIDQEQLRSKQYCVLMPWNLIAFWAEPMVAICLLMVSTDRLLAVVMPIVYYKKSANLQNIQIVMWNVTMLLITSVSWYYSLTDTNQMLSPFCWTSDAMFPVFNSLTLLVTIATSVSSVILYVIVFVLSRKRAVRPRDKQQFGGTFQQQQRRLTVTLGISCIFTLVLYVLPVCVKYTLIDRMHERAPEAVHAYCAISCNLTPITNIGIIVLRHREMRHYIRRLLPSSIQKLLCKQALVPTHVVGSCTMRRSNCLPNEGKTKI
uniref:G-protein coupled receptors family 1 profile domain-containing protein n=1 Tax=Parascaris univalens TaxID=6257 RepID=A0A915C7U0_PARUN